MTGLTLCMIVRDEQERLPRCLASVADLIDELVVVDTGSHDDTVRIAREHGAVVVPHVFDPPDFAAARNRGLALAHGEFILVLDADEVLAPGSAEQVRALVSAGAGGLAGGGGAGVGGTGWIVTRHNFPPGEGEPAWVDHAVRLFPNRPAYRFRGRVHETVDEAILAAGGHLHRCGVVLEHHLAAENALRDKWSWYVELLRDELAEAPDDPDRLVFLMADYYKLHRFDEATAIAQRVAELSPADFTAQFQAALCTFVHGHDPVRARGYLASARAIRPNDPEARELGAALDAARDLAVLVGAHTLRASGPVTRSPGGVTGARAETVGTQAETPVHRPRSRPATRSAQPAPPPDPPTE